jgi:hypothetical protein
MKRDSGPLKQVKFTEQAPTRRVYITRSLVVYRAEGGAYSYVTIDDT